MAKLDIFSAFDNQVDALFFTAGYPSSFIEAFANPDSALAHGLRAHRHGRTDNKGFVYGA